MKCEICKKHEAVFHLQQVVSGVHKELHLCAGCAQEKGLCSEGDRVELSLPALFAELFAQAQARAPEKTCPVCSRTLSQIVRSQTVGCPECYTYFAGEIRGIQKKLGIEGAWTGTLPRRLGRQKSVLSDRALLQNKLEESLAREDYEKAAIYRDRIRLLEQAAPVAAQGGALP
ncbi:MAG: UvrB/UvrC motif-containing protein [Spirochaetaceae bacterium]|jgi:protein arginine kinase activator|nr:UvrB/UvrC motif-containing protein [Spirochaetaceae bacterium]